MDINELKQKVIEVKDKYPNIDENPNSHDGCYELMQTIIRQYKNMTKDEKKEISINDIQLLYQITKLTINYTTKQRYIIAEEGKDHLCCLNKEHKNNILQKFDEIKKNYNEYTNKHESSKKIGLFGEGLTSIIVNSDKFKVSNDFPRNFIDTCTTIIDKNDTKEIRQLVKTCLEKEENINSSGVVSQILHVLKPNIFPVFNEVGMQLYWNFLNENIVTNQDQVDLKNYITACDQIDKIKNQLNINNYRILDIIAQKLSEQNKHWFIKYNLEPSNSNQYDNYSEQIDQSYNENDKIIYWNEKNICQDAKKNDYVYLYSTNEKRIKYKGLIIEKIPYNGNEEKINHLDEKHGKGKNEKAKNYYEIKLQNKNETDDRLTLGYIKENKLLNQIRSKQKIKNTDLIDILNEIFGAGEPVDEAETSNKGSNMTKENTQPALNQILYGPPGTGKTYNTVIEAIRILDENLYNEYKSGKKDYKDLKEKFDDFKKDGRIEFVTFHQSYSYEEFVEGIKPVLENEQQTENEEKQKGEEEKKEENKSQDLKYERKDGIFKDICNSAKTVITEIPAIDFEKQNIYKMSLGEKGKKEDENVYGYCINNNIVALKYSDIDLSDCDSEDKVDNKYGKETVGNQQLKYFRLNMKEGDIVVISNGNEKFRAIARIIGDYEYKINEITYNHYRKVEWLYVGNDIDRSRIYEDKFNQWAVMPMQIEKLNREEINKIIHFKPFVLIIDEINRGNISKIFGELITLIEPDKRLGEKYELEVTLPYSNKPFGVPNNLYIIGTMNTADRSIASVDIALRRRFRFIEMMPKPELLKGAFNVVNNENKELYTINLEKLLETLNERISILLDPDHQIGHSYFMKLFEDENGNKRDYILEDDLKDVFKYEILPLLNEYFYGDWEKIMAILIEHNQQDNDEAKKDKIKKSFIEKIQQEPLFNINDCETIYKFKNDNELNIENALDTIKSGIIPKSTKVEDKTPTDNNK